MKKVLLLSTALLLGVAVVTSCKKEDNNPSEEQLINALRTSWAQEGLYGKPQKVVETAYANKYLQWDSVAKKPVTPTAIYSVETKEYNSAGYITSVQAVQHVITGAKTLPDGRIVITGSELRPTGKFMATYDGKNRTLTTVEESSYYIVTYGGVDFSNFYNNLYVGDTVPDSLAKNSDPLLIEKESYGYKDETSYDDDAKLATIISYNLRNGEWVENGRAVVTLNQYGFIDDNSSSWYSPAGTRAAVSANRVKLVENDDRGNWTLKYEWITYMGQDMVFDYTTRSIQYY